MLIFITAIPRSANEDGYSWTKLQNALFYGLGTPAYVTSVLTFMFLIFTGWGNAMKSVLSAKPLIVLSNLGFAAFLVYPLVINAEFSGTDKPYFIAYPTVIFSFIQSIVGTFMVAFLLHIIVQAPADNIIRVTKKLFFGDKLQSLEKIGTLPTEEEAKSVQAKDEEQALLQKYQEAGPDFISNPDFKLKTK